MSSARRWILTVVLSLTTGNGWAQAQMIANQAPLRTLNDSFFEQIGTNWSIRGRGFFVRMGGANPAVPPFGNANPNAGVQGGFGFGGGGGLAGSLGYLAAQGARRSNVMQSGNLTVFNGVPGFAGDLSQSPFVVGFVPVVNGGGLPWKQQLDGQIPLQRRDAEPKSGSAPQPNSTAHPPRVEEGGLQSLAEIARQHSAADEAAQCEVRGLLEKAKSAELAGKASLACLYYQMVARRASGEAQQQAVAALSRLGAERPAGQAR